MARKMVKRINRGIALGTALACLLSVPAVSWGGYVQAAADDVSGEQTEETVEERIIRGIEEGETEINILEYQIPSQLDASGELDMNGEYGKLWVKLFNSHPELYYVDKTYVSVSENSGYIALVRPRYLERKNEDEQTIKEETARVLAMTEDGMTNLEKVLTVHDYLCLDVEYSYNDYVQNTVSADAHTMKGAVVDKKAVCDGYASAFQYYMQKLGIPCHMITGELVHAGQDMGEPHAWNEVQLDGKWYLVDVTADDPVIDRYGNVDHSYFLKSSFADHVNIDYQPEPCNDDRYKDGFWNDAGTQIIRNNGQWYYVDKTGALKKSRITDKAGGGETVTQIGGVWNLFGNSTQYYTGSYAKLAKKDGKLYYTQPDGIYICEFDGTDKVKIVDADTSLGYVYGMKIQGDSLFYQISKGPNPDQKNEKTVEYALDEGMDLSAAVITLSGDTVVYGGKQKYPEVTVQFGNRILTEGKDYKVTCIFPETGVGTAQIIVTGIGLNTGTCSAFFEIVKAPQSDHIPDNNQPDSNQPDNNQPDNNQKENSTKPAVKTPAKVKKTAAKAQGARKVVLTWAKQNCDGYRIQISLKSNFKKIEKTIILKGGKKQKRKITGLKSRKKYYIRIQAYKMANGERIYGTFSKKIKVRVK